jgi:hypothetical protein
VTLDRQSIERRDFPIGRRGYEPAAVDTHLRSLAAEVDELERSLSQRGHESLGSAAGSQVQSILEAAEITAADIEQQAAQAAAAARQEADSDAQRTRSDAVARAHAHVHAVSQATAALLEKVESMDHEVSALVQSLRAGAGRLASDLRALETNMGELYDAASGSGGGDSAGGGVAVMAHGERVSAEGEQVPAALAHAGGPASPLAPNPVVNAGAPAPSPPSIPPPAGTATGTGTAAAPSATNGSSEHVTPAMPTESTSPPVSVGADDLDGARLIALNMALNGEPREQADRYLAEHFDLSDREKLLDEVYAAIDG